MAALSVSAVGVCACGESEPQSTTDGGAPMRRRVDLSGNRKFDILFMVDNSNVTSPIPFDVANAFPQLTTAFAGAAASGFEADLHIGVVTSDLGAGATGAPGCSPAIGGQQGRLQAIGAKAAIGCKPLMDAPFVDYAFGAASPTRSNLPSGQSLDDTLACISSVGESGCGFEHQLESVRYALAEQPKNQGFLRSDAVLAVFFDTDEDDASAPPDSDVFDRNKSAQYGYEDSYSRQTRFAVVCCPPGQSQCADSALTLPPYGDSGGPLSGCRGAPNDPLGSGPGKQYDVHRYVDFFTKPMTDGGVKTNPLDVVLFAVDGPEQPFQVILSNPGTQAGVPYQPCAPLDEFSNPPCVPVLQPACWNPTQQFYTADPAVRINSVVRAAEYSGVASLCDGDTAGAMQRFASLLVGRMAGCVHFALPRKNGTLIADCEVSDESESDPTQRTLIAQCGNGVMPCWRLEANAALCGSSPDGIAIRIDRSGPAPNGTRAAAICTAG